MSFFLGGSDNAAPVLVKHIASDFLLFAAPLPLSPDGDGEWNVR